MCDQGLLRAALFIKEQNKSHFWPSNNKCKNRKCLKGARKEVIGLAWGVGIKLA